MSKASPDPSRARGSRILTRALVVLGTTVASLVLLEIGLRIHWARQGRPFDAQTGLLEIRKAGTFLQSVLADFNEPGGGSRLDPEGPVARARTEQVLHPYFAWDLIGPQAEHAEQRRLFRDGDPDEPFDVLVLGGSVAAGFAGAAGREELFGELASDPRLAGRTFRLFNHAVPGYKQPQQLTRLAYLLTMGLAPDLVINLDGFNEVALGKKNSTSGTHPLHPSRNHWSRLLIESGGGSAQGLAELAELRHHQLVAEARIERSRALGLHRFVITTELAAWCTRQARHAGHRAYARFTSSGTTEASDPSHGPRFDPEESRVMELIVSGWANASVAMHGICAERGITYLHVLQPTLHDRGSKPLTEEELAGADCFVEWRDGVALGYPLMRAAGASLTAAGVSFLDASATFVDVEQSLYFDSCHFVASGHRMLARRIAKAYLRRLTAVGPQPPARGFHASLPR